MTVRNILFLGAVILFSTAAFRPFSMENQAQYVYHAADTRGHADHGWLDAYHSFSFASWHNPERMHFGALRVLNDDFIAAGAGFNTHPHDNMEIVTCEHCSAQFIIVCPCSNARQGVHYGSQERS